MDWVSESKALFTIQKPEHFTNFSHCEECEEHDQTLIHSSIDEIGMAELGNPGWDPICFCSVKGKIYYMPSFIRLSIETMSDDFYFSQFLFHLEYDGKDNALFHVCNPSQRQFIASFVEYVILNHSEELKKNSCEDDALRTYEIWSSTE